MRADLIGQGQIGRVNRWLHNNIFFVCLAFVLVYFVQAHSLGNAFRNEQAFAGTTCKATNARSQDVLNFWYDIAADDDAHAKASDTASKNWQAIGAIMAAKNVGSNELTKHAQAVSPYWKAMGASYRSEAARIRQYVVTIQSDYNRACGTVAPSPQPPFERNT